MLRHARDMVAIQEAKVPLLICEHEFLEPETPRGRYFFGHLVLNAQLEAELCGERVRAGLAIARARGRRLGTANPRVRGRSARAQKERAVGHAQRFKRFLAPLLKQGMKAPSIAKALNSNQKAVAMHGRAFSRLAVHRMISRLQ